MTWRTSSGERVLGPCERTVFLDFFDLWWEMNGGFEHIQYNIAAKPFLSLTKAQKHSVIEEVLVHLLGPTETCPELTAANESCIYSCYSYMLETEMEMKEGIYGEAILQALEERGCKIKKTKPEADEDSVPVKPAQKGDEAPEEDDDDAKWPYMGCKEEWKWDMAIEFLVDSILWDRDWDFFFVQAKPSLMKDVDIDPKYFKIPRAKTGAKKRVEMYPSSLN